MSRAAVCALGATLALVWPAVAAGAGDVASCGAPAATKVVTGTFSTDQAGTVRVAVRLRKRLRTRTRVAVRTTALADGGGGRATRRRAVLVPRRR